MSYIFIFIEKVLVSPLLGVLLGGLITLAATRLTHLWQFQREEKIRRQERASEIVKTLHGSFFVIIDGIHELTQLNRLDDQSMNIIIPNLIRDAKVKFAESRGLAMIFMGKELDDKLTEMMTVLSDLSEEIRKGVSKNGMSFSLKNCVSMEKFGNLLEQITFQISEYANRKKGSFMSNVFRIFAV